MAKTEFLSPSRVESKVVAHIPLITRQRPSSSVNRFCLVQPDYDYETNREIVRSSLSNPPAYEHFYADWPAALINSLIERGDIDLISQLFASANWADGAASIDLSGYFTKDFRKYPRDFLLRLGKEPYAIRNKVYYLFMHDEMLSKEDVRQIREQLLSLNRESELSQIAHEMLIATSTFAPNG